MSALGRFFSGLALVMRSRNILPKRWPLNRVNSAFISGRIKVAQSIDNRPSTQQWWRVGQQWPNAVIINAQSQGGNGHQSRNKRVTVAAADGVHDGEIEMTPPSGHHPFIPVAGYDANGGEEAGGVVHTCELPHLVNS